jgi:hypothetical protein
MKAITGRSIIIITIIKTFLRLMEFNPNFIYMLQSATAGDSVYLRYNLIIYYRNIQLEICCKLFTCCNE